ncbi:MAG TPA: hypothetical protein VK171_01030 [Fimbriimonas sp.]|nr:hypothetical protein [Fimbriimonas sp.]
MTGIDLTPDGDSLTTDWARTFHVHFVFQKLTLGIVAYGGLVLLLLLKILAFPTTWMSSLPVGVILFFLPLLIGSFQLAKLRSLNAISDETKRYLMTTLFVSSLLWLGGVGLFLIRNAAREELERAGVNPGILGIPKDIVNKYWASKIGSTPQPIPTEPSNVFSNYPRGQVAEVRGDVAQLRSLEEAFFRCNWAVLIPLVVGVAILVWGPYLFPFGKHLRIAPNLAIFVVIILTGVLIHPAIDSYCDAKGHGLAQRFAYLLSSALLAPFCIGFLVIAALQSNIMSLLVGAGVVGEKERLDRKRVKSTLDLFERNQRLEPLPVVPSEERG